MTREGTTGRHDPQLCRHEPPRFAMQTEPPLRSNEHEQYIQNVHVQLGLLIVFENDRFLVYQSFSEIIVSFSEKNNQLVMNFKKTNGDRFLHDCFLKNDRFC